MVVTCSDQTQGMGRLWPDNWPIVLILFQMDALDNRFRLSQCMRLYVVRKKAGGGGVGGVVHNFHFTTCSQRTVR